jgi:hypothetical protein
VRRSFLVHRRSVNLAARSLDHLATLVKTRLKKMQYRLGLILATDPP